MKLAGSNNMEDWEHLFLYSMSDVGHFCWGSNLLQSVFEITKCASLSYQKYSSLSIFGQLSTFHIWCFSLRLDSDLIVGYKLTNKSLLQAHLTLDNPNKYWYLK